MLNHSVILADSLAWLLCAAGVTYGFAGAEFAVPAGVAMVVSWANLRLLEQLTTGFVNDARHGVRGVSSALLSAKLGMFSLVFIGMLMVARFDAVMFGYTAALGAVYFRILLSTLARDAARMET